jgi:hypothetical protein
LQNCGVLEQDRIKTKQEVVMMKKSQHIQGLCILTLSIIITILLLSACQSKSDSTFSEHTIQYAQNEQTKLVVEPPDPVDNSITEEEEYLLEPDNTKSLLQNDSLLSYFTADEAQYNGIVPDKTTVEEVLSWLGEPVSVESSEHYEIYYYEDAEYYCVFSKVDFICVSERTNASSPRGIRIGDTFAEVLNKFPQEKDYLSNTGGYFYGSDVWSEPVGYVSNSNDSIEIIVTADPWGPALKVYFKSDKVTSYRIFYPE